MAIKFIDTDDEAKKPSDVVGYYLAKKYIEEQEKKEAADKAAKDKAKKPDPVKITMVHALILLVAASPFVAMITSTMVITWLISTKELLKQLQ